MRTSTHSRCEVAFGSSKDRVQAVERSGSAGMAAAPGARACQRSERVKSSLRCRRVLELPCPALNNAKLYEVLAQHLFIKGEL